MPTVAHSDIPPPRSWDEFEDLVRDLYAREWGDSRTQRHGRTGQPQQGVDVYGQPRTLGGQYAAIQCKRYGEGKLTRAGIKAEIAKAEQFTPTLADYTIATTESCDAPLQHHVRTIDEARRAAGTFPVHIVFWEDLRGLLTDLGNRDLLQKYYPEYFAFPLSPERSESRSTSGAGPYTPSPPLRPVTGDQILEHLLALNLDRARQAQPSPQSSAPWSGGL